MYDNYMKWLNGELEEHVGAYEAWTGAWTLQQEKIDALTRQVESLQSALDSERGIRYSTISGGCYPDGRPAW